MSTKKEKPKRKNSGGVKSGPPPKSGPNPQGIDAPVKSILEKEIIEYFGLKKGGCPHREPGVKSDIKGISPAQITGKKFIGVR